MYQDSLWQTPNYMLLSLQQLLSYLKAKIRIKNENESR